MNDALARLRGAKIEVVTRQLHAKVAAVEAVIKEARALSMRINAWEWRWPLNTYRMGHPKFGSKFLPAGGCGLETVLALVL